MGLVLKEDSLLMVKFNEIERMMRDNEISLEVRSETIYLCHKNRVFELIDLESSGRPSSLPRSFDSYRFKLV